MTLLVARINGDNGIFCSDLGQRQTRFRVNNARWSEASTKGVRPPLDGQTSPPHTTVNPPETCVKRNDRETCCRKKSLADFHFYSRFSYTILRYCLGMRLSFIIFTRRCRAPTITITITDIDYYYKYRTPGTY